MGGCGEGDDWLSVENGVRGEDGAGDGWCKGGGWGEVGGWCVGAEWCVGGGWGERGVGSNSVLKVSQLDTVATQKETK